ncbi:MAG: hypothetical protein GF401_15965 [Chitinivibrionales bacterium]|nr:hypothetical protein [Chitinivibrionales bacterium]
MVGYDSIIPPGQVGKLTQEISAKNFHGGNFKKSVTVISNAKNSPTLRLSVRGHIKPVLGLSTHYFTMNNNSEKPFEVTLTTEKKNLKVSEIAFKSRNRSKAAWQSDLPLYVSHKLIKPDKVKKDGYYDYTLQMSPKLDSEKTVHGEFIIKTNHPEKKEIKIRGRIEMPRK